jgi:hypothetical protein
LGLCPGALIDKEPVIRNPNESTAGRIDRNTVNLTADARLLVKKVHSEHRTLHRLGWVHHRLSRKTQQSTGSMAEDLREHPADDQQRDQQTEPIAFHFKLAEFDLHGRFSWLVKKYSNLDPQMRKFIG